MRRRSTLAALLGVLAGALLLAGCGEKDEGTTGEAGAPAGQALTKAEFIEQGDVICREVNKDAEAGAKGLVGDPENIDENMIEEVFVEVLAPSLKRQAEELRALGVPAGEEEEVEAILASLEGAAAEIEDDPKLALAGKGLKEAGQLAGEYGFEGCGSVAAPGNADT